MSELEAARKVTEKLLIDNAELRGLLRELIVFEFPRQSWRHHPSPRGRALWSKAERLAGK